jgi:hypothetical protein
MAKTAPSSFLGQKAGTQTPFFAGLLAVSHGVSTMIANSLLMLP